MTLFEFVAVAEVPAVFEVGAEIVEVFGAVYVARGFGIVVGTHAFYDILVVAIGRAGFITADMVRPGATVVDVGINRTDAGLVGDVDFESVREVAGLITPVPGGVGPLTCVMLLVNTLNAARWLEN